MCGRYALALSNEELYDSLENSLPRLFRRRGRPRWERQQDHHATYNIAPRSRGTVIRRDPEDSNEVIIETMQWGLIPHWTKYPPSGPMNTINARSEGILDASSGGMWHALKGHKRCIVPAQGYYEWQKKSNSKIAHFTRLPLTENTTVANPPLLFFAGLFDTVKYVSPVESRFQPSVDSTDKREPYPTGNPLPLSTFTILTTEPAKDLRWLHDRMPCILTTGEEISRWLDLGEVKGWEEGKGGTGDLLKGKEGLDSYPVPPEVGKIGTNSPTYIQPVSERADGIKSFFSKQAPSPAKSKKEPTPIPTKSVKSEPISSTHKMKEELKEEAEGIETEIGPGDEEKGLGDDSNAPNVKEDQDVGDDNKSENKDEQAKEEPVFPSEKEERRTASVKTETQPSGNQHQTRSKRKLADTQPEEEVIAVDDGDDQEQDPKPVTKKGGKRTQVVRRNNEDTGKAQPAITSFFKSPTSAKKTRSK
ncbi:hypothetical protein CI109_103285 [Kwoniella shandongensis]|uniref:DUF159-domain-containing protein n=1 Tax=Kwoniella shandongensis TaxID=1734106 RepID=A0AAJ8MVB9_9TREE